MATPAVQNRRPSVVGTGELSIHGVRLTTTDSYKEVLDKTTHIYNREEELRTTLKSTLKAASKYFNVQKEQVTATTSLIDQLENLSKNTSGELSWLLATLRQSILSMNRFKAELFDNMAQDFFQPFEDFLEFKYRKFNHTKKKVCRSVREYQNHLDQFEKTNTTKDGKVDPAKFLNLEKELQSLGQDIGESTSEFIDATQEFTEVKTIELEERFSSFSTHLYGAHIKSSDVFSKMIPQIAVLTENTQKKKDILFKNRKEGYLLVKHGNTWTRELCEISDGKMYMTSPGTKSPPDVLDLKVCTLKQVFPEKEKEKSFAHRLLQIVTPGLKKPLIFQAETDESFNEWKEAILNGISLSLDNAQTKHQEGLTKDLANETVVKIIRSIPGNTTCADCGEADPTWASINLGVVICLNCSGVHRSLGVHITKVRSLTLDHWDPELVMFMGLLGNDKVNEFLEYDSSNTSHTKPNSSSTTNERKKWIIAKYDKKEFVPTPDTDYDASTKLNEMVQEEEIIETDVMDAIKALAYGAKINSVDSSGKTLLMNATMTDNWILVETLILHGADIFAQDSKKWSALHYACATNHYRSLQVLTRFGNKERESSQEALNEDGQTPKVVATQFTAKECIKLLENDIQFGKPTIDRLWKLCEENGGFTLSDCLEVTSPENIEEDNTKEEIEEEIITIPSSDDGQMKTSWKRGTEIMTKEPEKNDKRSTMLFWRKDKTNSSGIPVPKKKKHKVHAGLKTLRARSNSSKSATHSTGIPRTTSCHADLEDRARGNRSTSPTSASVLANAALLIAKKQEEAKAIDEKKLEDEEDSETDSSFDEMQESSSEEEIVVVKKKKSYETTEPVVIKVRSGKPSKKGNKYQSLRLTDFAFPTTT